MLSAFNYRSLYAKTLIEDFANEVQEANIYEQLIEEEKEQKREMINYWNELERESAGLSSLSSDDIFIENISESDEVQDLISTINSLVTSLSRDTETAIEEYYQFEEDNNTTPIATLISNIQSYNINSPFLQIDYDSNFSEEEIRYTILEFVNSHLCSKEDLESSFDSIESKDYFEIGDLLNFTDSNGNAIRLSIEGQLDPRDDDSDSLWIELYKNAQRVSQGEIEVYYGFSNTNEDGQAGDGAEDSLDYRFEKIVSHLTEIIQESRKDISKKIDNLKQLRGILAI